MVFLAVVPILVIAWTFTVFGTFKRTAKLLTGAPAVRECAVAVHSKTGFANHVAAAKFFRILCAALVNLRISSVTVESATSAVVVSSNIGKPEMQSTNTWFL